MTFSWGPIPTDLPVEVGMFEVFIGPVGFNADGVPAEQITYCRVAASESSCDIQDIPEGEWDAVVFMTSVTNDSFWSPSLTFTLGSTASVPSASPSPIASATPTPTQNVGATCPSLLQCMKSAKGQPLTNAPTLVYHYSESVHPKSKAALEALGAEYLGIYAGFYKDIKPGTKIHVYLSLDPVWCGKALVESEDRPAAELEKSYLCVQDGGANAGRSWAMPKTGIVVLRPHPTEVAGVEAGTSKSVMVRNIFIAELAHASRGLRYDVVATGPGQEVGIPIWLQYVSNEGANYLVGVEDGMSEAQQEDYSTWWGEPKRPTWRPTYTDPRLDGWTAGSGIFETSSGKRIVPNHYNLAYMAARYLIPKHGLFAIQDTLIGTILDSGGNQNAGAVALGYASWADLLGELDEAMLAYYAAANVTVPAK